MTGHYAPWTPEEDAQLRRLFEVERKTKDQIAALMPDRTFYAIASRTQIIGLEYQGLLSGWTVERDTLLRQLWVSGLSAGQIVKHMPGYTRNAIIGRVHRLGLGNASRAESTRAQQNIKPLPRVERKSPVRQGMIRFGGGSIPKSVIPEKPLVPERPAANPVTLEERRPDQCGWPVNDGNPYLYCGAVKSGHRRYCAHHACVGVGRGRAA